MTGITPEATITVRIITAHRRLRHRPIITITGDCLKNAHLFRPAFFVFIETLAFGEKIR